MAKPASVRRRTSASPLLPRDFCVGPATVLRALEVNPLWVNGDQVEALDVLVITEAREQQ